MIGLSLIRARGRSARSDIIRSFPLLASTVSLRAGCLLTSTKLPAKYKSLKAIRNIPVRAVAIALKVPQHSIR